MLINKSMYPVNAGYSAISTMQNQHGKLQTQLGSGEKSQTLAEMGIEIEASTEALDWLAQLGYDPQFGARPLKRVIQKRILNELSKDILAGKVDKDSKIKLDVFDNKFVFLNTEVNAER